MSLYNHLESKDAILDGIVEVVLANIELPSRGSLAWKPWVVAASVAAIDAAQWKSSSSQPLR